MFFRFQEVKRGFINKRFSFARLSWAFRKYWVCEVIMDLEMPKIGYSSQRAQGLWSLHRTPKEHAQGNGCTQGLLPEAAKESSRRNTTFFREKGKCFLVSLLFEKATVLRDGVGELVKFLSVK